MNKVMSNIKPQTEKVKQMFDDIAPTYDRLNHILSLSIDKIWRRRVVRAVRRLGAKEIVDIATGTGDLAEQPKNKRQNEQHREDNDDTNQHRHSRVTQQFTCFSQRSSHGKPSFL